MKGSERLLKRAQDVAEFRDRYIELMNIMEMGVRPGSYTVPELHPKPGYEDRAGDLFQVVARAAGRANVAAGEYSKIVVLTQFGQSSSFDPIVNWQYSINMPEHLPARTVVDTCEGIIGTLQSKSDDASRMEGTIAGRIASFVGFPARVRAAVAIEHPGLGAVAFGVGVFGQIVIGVVVALIVAAIVAAVAALWQTVA